jgi:hypothetical protein
VIDNVYSTFSVSVLARASAYSKWPKPSKPRSTSNNLPCNKILTDGVGQSAPPVTSSIDIVVGDGQPRVLEAGVGACVLRCVAKESRRQTLRPRPASTTNCETKNPFAAFSRSTLYARLLRWPQGRCASCDFCRELDAATPRWCECDCLEIVMSSESADDSEF